MPLSRLTCPVCLAELKPAKPVAEGARVRCPKCKGAFTAEGEPRAEEPVQEPLPSADAPPEEEPAEALAADEEVEVPRRRRSARGRDEEENRPRKRARKGGVPLSVWLAGGGVGLVLLCGCCGGAGMVLYNNVAGPNVSLASYNKIHKGMSEAEVTKILGAPTSTNNANLMHTDTWKNGDDLIIVSFVNDKALVGRCHISSGVGVTEVQGALP